MKEKTIDEIVDEIITRLNLWKPSKEKLDSTLDEVVSENENLINQLKSGNKKVISRLIHLTLQKLPGAEPLDIKNFFENLVEES